MATLLGLRTKGGPSRSLGCFRQAAERDPEFVLAHLGIAQCLNLISYWQYIRPGDGFTAALEAAEQEFSLAGELKAAESCLSQALALSKGEDAWTEAARPAIGGTMTATHHLRLVT